MRPGRTLEVEPPAYAALKHDPKLAGRVMDVALGGGVSTRKYKKTLDQTAEAVGISNSQVSRALTKALPTAWEPAQTRVIPGAEILAVFIDGFVVGSTHVIGAIGVKKDGTKMVLGVRGRQRKPHRGGGPAGGPARSWPDGRGAAAVHPRRRQGVACAVDAVYGKNAAVQRL